MRDADIKNELTNAPSKYMRCDPRKYLHTNKKKTPTDIVYGTFWQLACITRYCFTVARVCRQRGQKSYESFNAMSGEIENQPN